MTTALENQLYDDLAVLGIDYARHEHPAVFTVAESQAIDQDIPGAHTKNLFLKDQAGQFWLVTVPAERRVDLKALPHIMGSARLSFGKAEDMERLIAVSPGSVTPLAALADTAHQVRIVLDADLAQAACVTCHPLRNTATLGLSGPALIQLLRHWGHTPLIVAVPARKDAPQNAPAG